MTRIFLACLLAAAILSSSQAPDRPRARDLGIRMTVNSDSHHPSQLTYDYGRALALLRETGYREIARFDPARGGWAMAPLPVLG